jgi:hypothetical protein
MSECVLDFGQNKVVGAGILGIEKIDGKKVKYDLPEQVARDVARSTVGTLAGAGVGAVLGAFKKSESYLVTMSTTDCKLFQFPVSKEVKPIIEEIRNDKFGKFLAYDEKAEKFVVVRDGKPVEGWSVALSAQQLTNKTVTESQFRQLRDSLNRLAMADDYERVRDALTSAIPAPVPPAKPTAGVPVVAPNPPAPAVQQPVVEKDLTLPVRNRLEGSQLVDEIPLRKAHMEPLVRKIRELQEKAAKNGDTLTVFYDEKEAGLRVEFKDDSLKHPRITKVSPKFSFASSAHPEAVSIMRESKEAKDRIDAVVQFLTDIENEGFPAEVVPVTPKPSGPQATRPGGAPRPTGPTGSGKPAPKN